MILKHKTDMKSAPFTGCHQKILRAGGNMKSIQHFPNIHLASEKYNCSTLCLPVLNLNGTIKLRFLCPGSAIVDKGSDDDQKNSLKIPQGTPQSHSKTDSSSSQEERARLSKKNLR